MKIRALECDREKPYVGFTGAAPYHHAPRTTFQAWCRKGSTEDLQHFTRILKPETVERYAYSSSPLCKRHLMRTLIDLVPCALFTGLSTFL